MAESELTTIARPYARAAFSQGLDEASGLANWSRMLGMLSAAIQDDAVRSTLENPLLTRAQQSELVIEIMGDELSQQGRNFVTVLTENGRISLMVTISEIFELLKANHEKTVTPLPTIFLSRSLRQIKACRSKNTSVRFA